MSSDHRAARDAEAQLASIKELVAAYTHARATGVGEQDAWEAILRDPLDIQIRSEWQSVDGPMEPGEYLLLLSLGGAATRIIGELEGNEPVSARLEYQDWFTPWQELALSPDDAQALLDYARCFYFAD